MTNSALVVIDMQNDFIDGALGSAEAQKIVPLVEECIRTFDGQAIYVTMDNHYETTYKDYIEGQMIPAHCIHNTHGQNLESTISAALNDKRCGKPNAPEHGTIYFQKNAFGSIGLINTLCNEIKEFDINTIYIIGLCTDICVLSNALMIRAACPKTNIIVFEDCCAGSTVENHYHALQLMETNCITIDKYQLDF